MENWIPRQKRPQKRPDLKAAALVFLSLAAACLILLKLIQTGYLEDYLESDRKKAKLEMVINSVTAACANLGLVEPKLNQSQTNHNNQNPGHACFELVYPEAFSDTWLIEKVTTESDSIEDLICSSAQAGIGDDFVIYFIEQYKADTLAEIYIRKSSDLKPPVSSVSIVFDNFAGYNSDEALKLVWLNMPFGFELYPEQVPDDQLTRALKTSKGQCIIKLPDNREAWEIIVRGHFLAKRIGSEEISEENIYDILNHFPLLDGFRLILSDKPDSSIIDMITNAVQSLRLTYLYDKQSVSQIDSVLFLRGCRIKSFNREISCIGLDNNGLRKTMITAANNPIRPHKATFILSPGPENIEIIQQFLPFFERLNIVPAKPLRNAIEIKEL